MERRNITLTLEKAREWYAKGGELKEVALQAYKESELETITYKEICKKLFEKYYFCSNATGKACLMEYPQDSVLTDRNNALSEHQLNKLFAINQLVNVAKYLNKGWKPDWSKLDKKHIIYYNHHTNSIEFSFVSIISEPNVYFKSEELAKQAIDILGEDCVKLAIGTNW